MSSLQRFDFNDVNVRVHTDGYGEPWWVLADVCDALGLSSPHKVANRLDDAERGRTLIPTPSGEQKMTVVNEPGLYRTIFRSNKPAAEKFQRWVFHEVLPEIRKTGAYQPNTTKTNDLIGLAGITHQLTEYVAKMQRDSDQRFEQIEDRVDGLEQNAKVIGTELPDLETLRARFNGALRAASLSSGMMPREKTAFWTELNRALKQVNNGRARGKWEPMHYENAVHYLYLVRDIDIRWILAPVKPFGLEVVK